MKEFTFLHWSNLLESEDHEDPEVIVTWDVEDGNVSVVSVCSMDGSLARYSKEDMNRYDDQAWFEYEKWQWEGRNDVVMDGMNLILLKRKYNQ